MGSLSWIRDYAQTFGEAKLQLAERYYGPMVLQEEKTPANAENLRLRDMYIFAVLGLACLEKQRTTQPYNDRFRELLGKAQKAISLFPRRVSAGGDADDFRLMRDRISFVAGVVEVELFNMNVRESQHEEALRHLARAGRIAGDLKYDSEAKEEDLGFFDPQEAMRCFERLQEQSAKVDWKQMAELCLGLGSVLWVFDDKVDPTSRDIRASHYAFWRFAYGFAITKLTSRDLQELRDIEEQVHCRRHMEVLFFPGVWDQLPELARDALVQADVMWWSPERSSKSSVVENLWNACTKIIYAALWVPFDQHVRSGRAKDLKALKVYGVSNEPDSVPTLGKLLDNMFYNSSFRAFLIESRVPEEDIKFLFQARNDLKELNELRQIPPHKWTLVEQDKVRWAYFTFLGIGCPGILQRLARLQLKG